MGKRTIKTFQGLRWYACFLVFWHHALQYVDAPFHNTGAYFCVCVFFCLSGFLAQMKARGGSSIGILKECTNSFFHSAKKFYPLHWILLAFVAVPTTLASNDSLLYTIIKFILNALLLQSWIPNTDFAYSFNAGSWYLSATLLFSFLCPLIVKGIGKLQWKSSSALLGAILCLQVAIAYCPIPSLGLFIYVFPPIRLLDCIAGCLLYKIGQHFHDQCKAWFVNGLMIISALVVGGLLAVYNLVQDLTFFAPLGRVAVWSLPTWCIVWMLSYEDKLIKPIRLLFANRVVVYLGGVTFELYLLHKVILNCGEEGYRLLLHKQPDFLMLLIAFVVSLGIAIGLRFLDEYFRKKKQSKTLVDESHEGNDGAR